MSVFGRIGIVAVTLLAIGYAFSAPLPALPNESQAIGFRFGTLLGALGIPLIVAYIVAGRRKSRKPNLFAALFCGIGLFLLLGNAARSFGPGLQPETSEQKLRRLSREAAGLQPVRTSIFGESKTDAKLRGLFKDIIGFNKDYEQAADKLDTSATTSLTTPESFADPGSVAEGLRQLHAAYDLDALQEQRMQQILEKFRHSFDDLPQSERAAFVEAFDRGLARINPKRQNAVATEKAWVEAMDEVYAYAQSHHGDFVMSHGGLAVAHDDVREEFNTRVRALNARRDEFLQAKNEFERMQSESLQKMGLSREQSGMH
jgi:hypothetical protein